MQILPDSRVHRGETAFRHGFLIGHLPLMEDLHGGTFALALDVLDPIGALIPVPGKSNGLITFDTPTVGICLVRLLENGRRRPMLMPTSLVDALRADAANLGAQVRDSLFLAGATPQAAERMGLSVASALQGAVHRPDHYGVKMWSPHLDTPFGLVMAGDWIATPPDADPIPQPATSAEEASA